MNKNLHRVDCEVHLLAYFGAGEMLRITSDKKKGKVVLTVEGRIAGPWVGTLEQCWRELRAASPDEKFSINLCGVSFIDPAGKTLLKEIYRQGGQLVAEGCLNQAIVREIKDTGNEGKTEGGNDKEGHGPEGFANRFLHRPVQFAAGSGADAGTERQDAERFAGQSSG